MTRLRQTLLLVRPTIRAMSWGPTLWAAILALLYVAMEARGGYISYRILVLRIGALLLCMGSAFILDDSTEDTLGHVPMPLLIRRGLRVVLVLPVVALAWAALVHVAGDVPLKEGGPMPVADLTLEAATLMLLGLSAASLGAKLTADRLGGVVAAPIVLGSVAAMHLVPADYRLMLGSAEDGRWDQVHDMWAIGLIAVALGFVYLNRSTGSRSLVRSWLPRPRLVR